MPGLKLVSGPGVKGLLRDVDFDEAQAELYQVIFQ
jgi:hypothetical protein